ncbi:MAG: hypothetical protein DWQ06_11850 [Calditrichaeota bacterium]|nr:MAG: hypothetical protein DWQ06_11850 [Calditrichota bacterium]
MYFLILIFFFTSFESLFANDILIVKFKNIKAVNEVISGFQNSFIADKTRILDLDGKRDFTENSKKIEEEIEGFKPDLILAVGSIALDAVKNISQVPVVFTTVLNPKKYVSNFENICGISAFVSIAEKIKILKEIDPYTRNAAVVYSDSNLEEELNMELKTLQSKNIELLVRKVKNPVEFFKVVENLKDSVNAFIMVPDNTAKDEFFKHSLLLSFRHRFALIGIGEPQVKKSALLAVSVDHYENGLQAANIARVILSGIATPSTIGIVNPVNNKLFVNSKTAKQLNMKIPKSILDRSKVIND